MTALDKFETARRLCYCEEGEFIFYSCQYDGWAFLRNKSEWYEMGITCNECAKLFSQIKQTRLKGKEVMRISIKESEKIPNIKSN